MCPHDEQNTAGSRVGIPEWVVQHRRVWAAKPALRHYYETEIFARICARLGDRRTLELGAGPGFLSRYRPGMVSVDISPTPEVSIAADAHRLPFADATFDAIAGVDVLHHFEAPGRALSEAARVLRPGGRIVLVEPWTGPAGFLFYRYIHHEDCYALPDPWDSAFAPGKTPMDGNAWIPRAVLARDPGRLAIRAGLRLIDRETFGAAGFVLTGGFQPYGAPRWAVRFATGIERALPRPVRDALCLRVLYVAERL